MTPTGKIVYRLGIPRTLDRPRQRLVPNDLKGVVESIELSDSERDGLQVCFQIRGMYREEAKRETLPIAEEIRDMLVLHEDVAPGKLSLQENTLPQDPPLPAVEAVIWSLRGVTAPSEPKRLGEAAQEAFTSIPSGDNGEAPVLVMLYRIALEQDNPIASFLLLYSVMLWVTRPNEGREGQAHVDRKIVELREEEDLVEGARHDEQGTRFTKLRNDLSHTRRLDLAGARNLHREALTLSGAFRPIVREALLDYLAGRRAR